MSIRKRLIDFLSSQERGATIAEIESAMHEERHTLAKYLYMLKQEGVLQYRSVGRAKLWYVTGSPVRSILEKDREKKNFVEKFLSDLVDQSLMGVLLINDDMEISYANDKAKELLDLHELGSAAVFDGQVKELAKLDTDNRIYEGGYNDLHIKAVLIEYPFEKNSILVMVQQHI